MSKCWNDLVGGGGLLVNLIGRTILAEVIGLENISLNYSSDGDP